MKILLISIIFLNSMFLSACSTMINPGSQSILVRTRENKTVEIKVTAPYTGSYVTKAPTIISSFPSSFTPLSIEVIDDCYGHMKTRVTKRMDYSYLLNLLNIYGLLIDPITGFMWSYDEQIYLPLEEDRACEGKTEKTLPEVFQFSEEEPSRGSFQKTGGWSLIGAGSFATFIGVLANTLPNEAHSERNRNGDDWIYAGLSGVGVGIGLVIYGEFLNKTHKKWQQKKSLEGMNFDISFVPENKNIGLVYRFSF